MKVLILCTGNSCRSQMAQGFLKALDPSLEVYSAGTDPAGEVHPMAVEVMQEEGIDIGRNVPVHVERYLEDRWDYVITVCHEAEANCPFFSGDVKHRLHIGFDDPARATGSREHVIGEFRRVRNEIKLKFRDFFRNNRKAQQSYEKDQRSG